jgi:hypothetical protein
MTKVEFKTANKQLNTKCFGAYIVWITDIKPHPRYPNELFRVLWAAKGPDDEIFYSEFDLKFNDQFCISNNLNPYRDINSNKICWGNGSKLPENFLYHLFCDEDNDATSGSVRIFFSEDKEGTRLLSGSIVFPHLASAYHT